MSHISEIFTQNPILRTDSYKVSMFCQLPPDTRYVYSYIESRGGKYDRTVMAGLQIYLRWLESHPITTENIEQAASFIGLHGMPFNREGWEYIVRVHGGRLPLSIMAAPEGLVIHGKNVLLTVTNTDPNCAWLVTYIETALLRAVWYPVVTSTKTFQIKRRLLRALDQSCDDPKAAIGFLLHDFGPRGVSSSESAAIGGNAHLIHFQGSDNLEALWTTHAVYHEPMAAFSIPAMEHSTVTAWGRDHEFDSYRNMLDCYFKTGKIVAIVSDSYDLYRTIREAWGGEFKQRIIDSGARLVVRPDSGDPTVIPIDTIVILAEIFGTSMNNKGYRVLPPYIRVIQGDGVSEETIGIILDKLLALGFSSENLAFGCGGELLQNEMRDDLKFAMKCSAVNVAGDWRDVSKDPITDPGKKSKLGRLALVWDQDGRAVTVPLTDETSAINILREVWRDGAMTIDEDFATIRTRADAAVYSQDGFSVSDKDAGAAA